MSDTPGPSCRDGPQAWMTDGRVERVALKSCLHVTTSMWRGYLARLWGRRIMTRFGWRAERGGGRRWPVVWRVRLHDRGDQKSRAPTTRSLQGRVAGAIRRPYTSTFVGKVWGKVPYGQMGRGRTEGLRRGSEGEQTRICKSSQQLR